MGLDSRSSFAALWRADPNVWERLKPELLRARFQVSEDAGDFDRAGVILVGLSLDSPEEISDIVRLLRIAYPHAALVGLLAESVDASRQLLAALRAGIADAVIVGEDDQTDVVSTIRLAIESKRLETRSAERSESFTHELGERARELRGTNVLIEKAYEETLHALVNALDVREKELTGHSLRVTSYCCYLAEVYGVGRESMPAIYRGALLHDIGKIGIPDSILLKPARLTPDEFLVMTKHTELARTFLHPVEYLREASAIPYHHHEKWDGTGYPEGLSGTEIPLAARIFAVVDVFDALRSKRPYKEPYSFEDSQKIIREGSGTHFDPSVVTVFDAQPLEAWEILGQRGRELTSMDDLLAFVRDLAGRYAVGVEQ